MTPPGDGPNDQPADDRGGGSDDGADRGADDGGDHGDAAHDESNRSERNFGGSGSGGGGPNWNPAGESREVKEMRKQARELATNVLDRKLQTLMKLVDTG